MHDGRLDETNLPWRILPAEEQKHRLQVLTPRDGGDQHTLKRDSVLEYGRGLTFSPVTSVCIGLEAFATTSCGSQARNACT